MSGTAGRSPVRCRARATASGRPARARSARSALASIGMCAGSVSVAGAVTTPATYSERAAGGDATDHVHDHPARRRRRCRRPASRSRASSRPRSRTSTRRSRTACCGSRSRSAVGSDAPVTFGEGELDPSFGNHPAYLALTVGGHKLRAPALLVPGDDQPIRDVAAVSTITVGVQSPAPTPGFTPGTVTVEQGSHATTLTAAQLAALPPETLQASFLAGTTTTNVTEVGPSLDEVLRAAHVPLGVGTWVAGVGDDGYVAVVTPAEQWVGGKHLQISLNENGAPLSRAAARRRRRRQGRALRVGAGRSRRRPGSAGARFAPTPQHHR